MAYCLLVTALTHKQGFHALLTGMSIFEVQLFVEGSVVKIPANMRDVGGNHI